VKSLNELRLEADQQKVAFFDNLGRVKTKLKAEYLLNEVLHSVDPNSEILSRIENRTRSNPFPALAALGGLYLLVQQIISKLPNRNQLSVKRAGRSRFGRSTSKGEDHGRFDSTKHN
jgi:hypothetical protein